MSTPMPPFTEELEDLPDGTRQHGTVPALDDRPLDEHGVLGHEPDQLVVVRQLAVEPQLGDERLAPAQHVAGPQPRLAQQLAEPGLRQALDVVLDAVEVHAALGEQRREPPARRAGALLVDGELRH